MVDVVDPATRSRMMAGIKGKDTKPELLIRRLLHARGFRFALKPARLPGRPDIVLPRWRVAVFVHGCFWHWHRCSLSKMPSSNRPFWEEKLQKNSDRDAQAQMQLVSMGWRVATIWECATRTAAAKAGLEQVMTELANWIRNSPTVMTFETKKTDHADLR